MRLGSANRPYTSEFVTHKSLERVISRNHNYLRQGRYAFTVLVHWLAGLIKTT